MRRNLLGLSQDRIADYIGNQREVLLGLFYAYDPITADMLTGDRYVRG
jgi:hypothetical protein